MKVTVMMVYCELCGSQMTQIPNEDGSMVPYRLQHIDRIDCPNTNKIVRPPAIEVNEE